MTTSQNSAQVIAKAWLDEEFKSLPEKEPAAVLKPHGIEPDVVQPLPPRPDELNDELLEANMGADKYQANVEGFPLCGFGHIFCFSEKALEIKNQALNKS